MITHMNFKPGPRYRLASMTRFIAVLLVFLLSVTAVIVIVAENNESNGTADQTAVAVTPLAMPVPEPAPSPPSIPEGKAMEPVLVAIDAGHGGRDPGTISPYKDNFFEKDITLDIAKRVQKYLDEKGIDNVLTREGDDHLNDVISRDLQLRAAVANDSGASLFVSIHVNAYDLKYKGAAQVNGMEVYYLNKEATYENFTEERFAQIVGDQISEEAGIRFNGVKSRALSVLQHTEMPAILVETGYITNQEDHARLESKDFRDETALGIADGIELALDEINAFEYDGDLYVFKEVRE